MLLNPISVPEAAVVLGLSTARVRAMAASGQLLAEKIGGRWLLERNAVELRRTEGAVGGRRFTPRNAWALLRLASGEDVADLAPSVRSRLKRALQLEGLMALAPRLGARAEIHLFMAHPGELAHVLEDPALVATGVAVGGKVGILPSGGDVDGYLSSAGFPDFVERHALNPGVPPNVRLRVVPDTAWDQIGGRRTVPHAAMALDFLDDPNPRLNQAGSESIEEIEREFRAAAKARS